MNDVYHHALKLLWFRDYTATELRAKLEKKFGPGREDVIDDVIAGLKKKKFLDERRIAQNFLARKDRHSRESLRDRLLARGVEAAIIDEALETVDRPSLR